MELQPESEMLSEKGKKVIVVAGRKFSFHKKLFGGWTRWKCIKRSCKAYLKRDQKDRTILHESYLQHTCVEDESNTLVRQRISNSVKRKAFETFLRRPLEVIREELQDENSNSLNMDDVARIRKNIHATRVKDRKLPKNMNEVHDVMDEYKVITSQGENFLYYNQDAEDNDHIIMFTCISNLEELKAANTIYVDGTFKCCTKFFLQMFTIHILKNGWYAPLVFCLLPNKNKESYIRAFSIIREWVTASIVFADFEHAIHLAVVSVWPHIQVRGCRFHLGHSWWRAIRAANL